jgi:acyl-CoA thioesterase I
MRRFSLLVLSVCLLASACTPGGCGFGFSTESAGDAAAGGSPAQPADPAAPPARTRIVALGDSLTIGLGLLESESFPSRLQEKIDEDGYQFEIINAGVSGDTSAGGLRRLDWALEGNVRVMLLALGANDGLRGLSIAEMKQNLTTIIQRARERNIVVILVGMEAPPNYGPEYVQQFRAAFREVASKERVLFIPFLLDHVAGVSTLNQADGIHPNADGARQIAENVWPTLRSVLDQMAAAQ